MAPELSVSVIIPTYNRAALLVHAVKSVLSQTVPAHEVLLVDDGSADDTQQVMAELCSADARLKYIWIEHTPLVGRVRNAGAFEATGDVLAFLDSDDIWEPERIESQLSAWTKTPGAAIAFCNLDTFDEGGPTRGGPYLPVGRRYNGRILCDLLIEPIVVPSTMMVRREVFRELGPFTDGVIVEDYEFILEVAAKYDICYSPEILVHMRDHMGHRARSREELANLEYLNIVSRFLAAHPEISAREKACARQGLANVHLKLAHYYLGLGRSRAARKHLFAMARTRPLDRRLPGIFAQVLGMGSKPARKGAHTR